MKLVVDHHNEREIWNILFLISIVFAPTVLLAQACCSGGTPLAGNVSLRSMDGGSAFFDLTYDYNTQRSLLTGSELLDDDRRERNTNAILLRGSYAITGKLGVTGILSWVNEQENVKALNGGINQLSATGIGDAILMFQYEPVNWIGKNLVFGAGVKFPIGRFDIRNPDNGLLLNPDLQPGSGSWDWLFGINFQQQHVFKDNLTLMASVTGRINSEAERFEGQQLYKFGSELRINLGFNDRYLIGNVLIDPSLILLYRRTEIDQIQNVEVPNTGGNWIHLSPGLNWQATTNFSIGTSVEIPLFRDLRGTQLTTTNRFTFTLAYQLNAKRRANLNILKDSNRF